MIVIMVIISIIKITFQDNGNPHRDKKLNWKKVYHEIVVYDELIELLQALHQQHSGKGYDRRSMEIFERKQGRIFLEEMGKSGARNFAGIPDNILNRETALIAQLAELRKDRADESAKPEKDRNMTRIRELEQQIEAVKNEQWKLQAQIKTDYPEYHALKYPRPVSLKELQKTVLQPGEMMLIYGVMKEKTSLWVVGRDHFSLHAIEIGEQDLAEKVEAYRNLGIVLSSRHLRGIFIQPTPQAKKEIPERWPIFLRRRC